jgi:DNA replication protein DnaC
MRERAEGRTMTEQSSSCPLCEGSGFKMIDAEDAKGRPIKKATRCDCQLRARGERLTSAARIPKRYEHCEFDSFHTEFEGANRSLSNALIIAKEFVKQYPLDKERAGLLFTGSVGVGKTHLAISVIRILMLEYGIPCIFYDYRELLAEIKNSYNPRVQETELGILEPLFQTEVLVIDELGAVRPSEWVFDTVSQILNRRYNDKKTTIITTNLPDLPASNNADQGSSDAEVTKNAGRKEIPLGDRITDRMRSRLHEMCKKVEMTGADFRINVKSASRRPS